MDASSFLLFFLPLSELFVGVKGCRRLAVFWIRIVFLCESVSGSREQKKFRSGQPVLFLRVNLFT